MAESPTHPVRVEREGRITIITIAHPPANAISQAVVAGISQALLDAEADSECRAVILTGDGPKFFAAGADISEFDQAGGEVVGGAADLTTQMEGSRLPIVAAVNGIAYGGGCELCLASDVRLASDNARFGQPEIKLGIIPGWGGTQRLPRVIGRGPAMEMLLTGEPIDAGRALELSLVNRVVPADQLRGAALEMAGRLGAQAPLAVAASKRVAYRGLDRPLAEGLALEREAFTAIFNSDDAREGVQAFKEKRQPVWHGR